jgi:tetratricopeptide (TPR) repeat protein
MAVRIAYAYLRLYRERIALVAILACLVLAGGYFLAMTLFFLGFLDAEPWNGVLRVGAGVGLCAIFLSVFLAMVSQRIFAIKVPLSRAMRAFREGDIAAAADAGRQAWTLGQWLAPDDPWRGVLLEHLTRCARALGDYDESELFGQQWVSAQKLAWGEDHRRTVAAREFLARIYLDIARYGQAQAMLEQALQSGGPSAEMVRCLTDLGRSWAEQGQYARAEPYLRRALEMVRRLRIDDTPDGVAVIYNLASACAQQAKFDEAEALIHGFLQRSDKRFGPDSPIVAGTLHQLALIRFLQGRCEEAEPIARRALAILEKIAGANTLALATLLVLLGRILTRLGKLDEAEALLREALHAREEFLAPEHPLTAESFEAYAEVLKEQGRIIEAGEYTQRAGQIRDFHSPLRVISP